MRRREVSVNLRTDAYSRVSNVPFQYRRIRYAVIFSINDIDNTKNSYTSNIYSNITTANSNSSTYASKPINDKQN